MTQLSLYNVEGKSLGEVSASDEIFGQEMNESVVHSALVWFLASRRRGTHSTLTRGEVRGGGVKPWRQKGTGRARVGSIRSPLWRKGGVIFGPKPRKYTYNLPRKVRKLALKVALSDKARAGRIKVVEELRLAQNKTRLAAKVLRDLGVAGTRQLLPKILIILEDQNRNFQMAARNLERVRPIFVKDLNIFEVLDAEWIIVEKKVVSRLEEVLA